MTREIDQAGALLGDAQRIAILTGAGISAESGVPTFRGETGLWKSFRPEELATPEAFRSDPQTVWEWYAWRRALIAECEPNSGHHALARLALSKEGPCLVTQNVDGLHTRAANQASHGSDAASAIPIEVHGAIDRDKCSQCSRRTPGVTEVDVSSVDALLHCSACGGMLRPDVVWFGEALDPAVIGKAFSAAEAAEVCLVVGTSALVHPAASVPMATLHNGGIVIEVNIEDTPLTPHAAISLRGAAGDILPALLDAGDSD